MPDQSLFHGEGEHAVLLLHGLSSTPLELRYLARTLGREGFAASAPVIPGYSQGSAEAPYEDWIRGALAAFDDLSARYARVSVCGLSMGATLALAVASERPAAQALVLLSTTLSYDGWAIPWYRFLLNWAYFTPLRHHWRYREAEPFGLKNEALRAKVARAMQKDAVSEVGPATISLPAIYHASRLVACVRREMHRITSDCLIVHAIDDETSNPTNAENVARCVQSKFLRSVYLDDSYHMITVDNEREIVAREVVVFLRESEAATLPNNDAPVVVSKALARRLRHLAAVSKT